MTTNETSGTTPAPTRTGDRRSSAWRLYRKRVAELTADIGRDLSAAGVQLVEQAALISIKAEQMREAVLDGANVPADEIVRLTNSMARVLGALWSKQQREKQPDLHKYLANKSTPK